MKNNLYGLTNPQKSIWLTEQFCPNSNINNIAGDVFIDDIVNFSLLEKSINIYIQKNEQIRARLTISDGECLQYIHDYIPFTIPLHTITDSTYIDNLNSSIVHRPFTMLDSDLFCFALFRYENGHGGFIVNFHHIISDAWTMGIFVTEVMDIYTKLILGEDINFTLNPTYTDFIISEKKYKESNKFINDKEFWLSKFNDEPTLSKIMNYPNEKTSITANRKEYSLNPDTYTKISTFCKSNNCSVFNFLMAIYSIYLSGLNNTSNITIGTPVLNRTNFIEKHTAGMFISIVPFYLTTDFSTDFSSFVSSVSVNQLGIFRHQRFPYELLLKNIKTKYTDVQYLYDLVLSYQNAKDNDGTSRVPFHTSWLFNGTILNSMDIHFYDMDNSGILSIFYDYQISKFKEQDIENIHKRILYIIEQVLENPTIKLNDISIITKKEEEQIETIFLSSLISHPNNLSISQLVESIALKSPDAPAVFDDFSCLTYKELIEQSTNIANNLIKFGVKKGDCVSVLFEKKSTDLIASILGILKAGAFFLAVYTEYPDDRISYMLKNSHCSFLITEEKFLNKNYPVTKLNLATFPKILGNYIFPKIKKDDNAYIIYTSGSTGAPKGTLQTHNNLINFVYSFQHFLGESIVPNDRFLSVTNICFDVSMAEIFTPLVFGASVYLYKDLNHSSTTELCDYIIKNKITFSYFPPSMLSSIADKLETFENVPLDKLLVGVEPIKASILYRYLRLNNKMKIVNGYGPSETTICCTMYPFSDTLDLDSITPIGRPIGNSRIQIVNSKRQLLPIGEIGEIIVQGECVGNGYLYNEDMTKEHFSIADHLYYTGDLAKLLPDGNIMFVGRNDNQIKYRGYRIDLGEIEHSIKKISNVKNAIVLLDTANFKSERLIAFLIMDVSIEEEILRSEISKTLPHYMIPSHFVFLNDFPLTPNGKIDRKILLESEIHAKNSNYIPPSTASEIKMHSIWSSVLKKKRISINDNFFDLGGDSLDAMKISAIANESDISISAQDFYNYPTIYSLCNRTTLVSDTTKTSHLAKIIIEKNYHCGFTGPILFIGATGFLGSHLLMDILKNTPYTVYCLIRGTSYDNAVSRLKQRLQFYFNEEADLFFTNRIIVLNGDFSKEQFGLSATNYQLLLNTINTVINAAALVKHIGKYDYFYKMNILSVKNLTTFCMNSSNLPHFVHISTMSVSGDFVEDTTSSFFGEDDLFINQNLDSNVYIKTKFEAEEFIANQIQQGLHATIFRLGNISWRTTDGYFQINEEDNLFYNILKFIITTKLAPISLLPYTFNISPVDYCSKLILSILMKNNSFNVYHIYNSNELTLEKIINFLNELDYSIKIVDDVSYNKLKNNFNNCDDLLAHVNDMFIKSKSIKSNIQINNSYTNFILEQLDLSWPIIEKDYFSKKFKGDKE